jgi:hypothetical protein
MAINEEDIIYILTKEDVDGVAKTIGLSNLTYDHYRMAQKYIESFCSNPGYDWVNAITDALQYVEKELRGVYSDPKTGE